MIRLVAGDRFFDQLVEHAGLQPFGAPVAHGGLACGGEPGSDVPGAAGDQPRQGWAVKQFRSGMRGRWQPRGCVSGGRGGRWPSDGGPDGVDDAGIECEHGVLLLVSSHWYLK